MVKSKRGGRLREEQGHGQRRPNDKRGQFITSNQTLARTHTHTRVDPQKHATSLGKPEAALYTKRDTLIHTPRVPLRPPGVLVNAQHLEGLSSDTGQLVSHVTRKKKSPATQTQRYTYAEYLPHKSRTFFCATSFKESQHLGMRLCVFSRYREKGWRFFCWSTGWRGSMLMKKTKKHSQKHTTHARTHARTNERHLHTRGTVKRRTSEATTKVTGPRPSEKANMKPHSQIRVTMVPQFRRKARPTIARVPVTSTLLTKNNGRRPILFRSTGRRFTGRDMT